MTLIPGSKAWAGGFVPGGILASLQRSHEKISAEQIRPFDEIRSPEELIRILAKSQFTQILSVYHLNLIEFMDQLERAILLEALTATQGNISQASVLLGLNRKTMFSKVSRKRKRTMSETEG